MLSPYCGIIFRMQEMLICAIYVLLQEQMTLFDDNCSSIQNVQCKAFSSKRDSFGSIKNCVKPNLSKQAPSECPLCMWENLVFSFDLYDPKKLNCLIGLLLPLSIEIGHEVIEVKYCSSDPIQFEL